MSYIDKVIDYLDVATRVYSEGVYKKFNDINEVSRGEMRAAIIEIAKMLQKEDSQHE